MKKVVLSICLIVIVFFVSCKNSESADDLKTDSTSIVIDENVNDNQVVSDNNSNSNVIELKAQFNGIYLGSGGAGMLFSGQDGKEYDFYDDGNEQVHKVFEDVDPTQGYDKQKHVGEWYNLKYKTKTIQRYDGSTGDYYDADVLVIVSVEPANAQNTSSNSGISLNTLKNCVFFGNQDINWTMKFKDSKIEYTPNIGESTNTMYYYPDKNSCLEVVSANEVKIKATFDMDRGYISTITIKRESCSDGESDTDYPYSVSIKWEDSNSTGCGRNL